MLPQGWVNLATVGTEQSDNPVVEIASPLAELLEQLPESGPEAKLLLAVAGLQLQQKAGYIPPQDRRSLPPPDEVDERPICSQDAMRYLHVMLTGHYEKAIFEWFRAVAERDQRIPAESLPLLLDTGRKQPELQSYIAPLLGQRGLWLAQEGRSRKWDWLRLDVEKVWNEGKTAERIHLLTRLRQTEPDQAREMLEATWTQENADAREKFLSCLAYNLSMVDEPFLEAALDDRGKQVRQTAVDLLALIPEARFCHRMQGRVAPLLEFTKTGLRRKPTLVFTLPEECTQAMKRDGIQNKIDATYQASSPEASWLAQMLRYVPPATWYRQWDFSPQALVQAARNGKAPFDIITVWGWASYRANDVDFMAYLLQDELKNLDNNLVSSLAQKLPAETLERVAHPWLTSVKEGLTAKHPVLPILQAHQQMWSREFTLAVLEALKRYLHRGNVRPDHVLRTAILDFACFFPVDIKGEVMKTLDIKTSAKNVWGDLVDEVDLLLDFRQKMLGAIYA